MFRFSIHPKHSIIAVSIIFAIVGTGPARASAQTVEQSGAPAFGTCETNATAPGAYTHCVLTMKHSKLERGGALLGIESILRPIGLSQFVAGDSATRYAREYETQTTWAMRLQVVGGLLALSPFVASHVHPCQAPSCPSRLNPRNFSVGQVVGVALIGIGIPLQVHGRRQGYKAISLYNASLGH